MGDTSTMTVGPKGRIVIPVEIRRHLGLVEGSELVAMVQDDGLFLLPREAVKGRLRGLFAGVRGSMAEELISDRRAAATQESMAE